MPETPAAHLFHLVDEAVWAEVVRDGRYAPASLATEGFVHCSYAHQVAGVAAARYAGVPDLVVVELDPAGLDVRDEDSYGAGVTYPHVYGPIPVSAAVAAHPLSDLLDGTVCAAVDR
ncbi:MAG: DUF952 domain-containing protein [Jatrophihabitans sp.]|nr:MAG: DUF952 domain-containing protein [Jatrophihabitans sp.]